MLYFTKTKDVAFFFFFLPVFSASNSMVINKIRALIKNVPMGQ